MNIDVSKIIQDKLAQLEADGVIQKKIENSFEKAIIDAITSEIECYSFREGIRNQLRESVSEVAKDCGLAAYNGFIAQTVKSIVQDRLSADITSKIEEVFNDIMVQKHVNVRLSDIFKKYREWVFEYTDEEDKYEYERYTADLEQSDDGIWKRYTCKFSDRPLETGHFGRKERADIEIRFTVYGDTTSSSISGLYLDNHDMKNSIKIGTLSAFEAFVVNLYYNGTEITLDVDDVDDDTSYDIDY